MIAIKQMFNKCTGFLFSAVLILSVSCYGPASDNCPDGLSDEVRAVAKCSVLEVPQNRVRDTGVTLKLPVIRFESPTSSSKPPLLYLEGGPGASSLNSAEKRGPGLAALLQRDILYLEQRGTVNAWPSLVCRPPRSVAECEQQWVHDKVDLASYNTIESAGDIAELSKQLGTRFVLWGSSYGTLLAQRVVQRHPEVVDSLIFEGSIPSDGSQEVWRSNPIHDKRVLQRFSQWLKKKWAEVGLYPTDIDPEIDFPEAINAITQSPHWHGVTGEGGLPGAFNFIKTGRGYPKIQTSLALWAYNVRKGINKKESAEWLENILYSNHGGMVSMISEPMYFATNCSDTYQFWSLYNIAEVESASGLPEKLNTSNIEHHAKLLSLCKNLGPNPSGYPAEEFRIPAKSLKKTLFLVGMLDTQTPAELAPISNFPNSQVVRGECLGHSFFADQSLFGILKSFLGPSTYPTSEYLVSNYCSQRIEFPVLESALHAPK